MYGNMYGFTTFKFISICFWIPKLYFLKSRHIYDYRIQKRISNKGPDQKNLKLKK